MRPYIQVEDPQETKDREYIANRNYFCDLLGRFKVVNDKAQDGFEVFKGDTLEILTWSCNPYRMEDAYSVSRARLRINPVGDEGEILQLPYDTILYLLGKKRYVHQKIKPSA